MALNLNDDRGFKTLQGLKVKKALKEVRENGTQRLDLSGKNCRS